MSTIVAEVERVLPFGLTGSVTRITGLTAAVAGFPAPLGATVRLERDHGAPIEGEVVGFQDQETLLLPYGDLAGVRRGTRCRLVQTVPRARVGDALLGRVINGRGHFIDGLADAVLPRHAPLHPPPIPPLSRPRIDQPLDTGVRALDGLLTAGRGQRLGIFAGSGVGKSTLMGQIARGTTADVNVVVLIGERGREVREFIEKDLGPVGLARSVVIVATGDDPALLRLRAAYLGTSIAESFRDTGRDVLLMMDSVTRFALAQREIGLAAGEPPATRGYPPSVFALMPRLLERSGRNERGSITGFYTVLVEGDDTNEPIADTARGILDGHIVLTRKLAQQGHYPAIDVLQSISRLMSELATDEHRQAAQSVRQLMAAYQQSEDLIAIGAYQAGTNPTTDAAIQLRPSILQFLQQRTDEPGSVDAARAGLIKLARLREANSRRMPAENTRQ
jgi:flagellum-specific ATP synthase